MGGLLLRPTLTAQWAVVAVDRHTYTTPEGRNVCDAVLDLADPTTGATKQLVVPGNHVYAAVADPTSTRSVLDVQVGDHLQLPIPEA